MNKIILFGHLGKDVELRATQSGTSVASFSMATKDRAKRGDEWVDSTDWHNIVVWGKLAELADKYLSKGSQCLVEGKVKTRSYEDKEGVTKYVTEVVASSVEFGQKLSEKKESAQVSFTDDDISF